MADMDILVSGYSLGIVGSQVGSVSRPTGA